MTTLSIILPNYNDGHYLEPLLRSLLPHMPHDVECIICDDGSTDDSVERVKRVIVEHENVVLLQNKKNLGTVPTLNHAASRAKGRYRYYSSSNDVILPFPFFEMVSLLRKVDVAAVTSDVGTCSEGYDGVANRKAATRVLLPNIEKSHFFSPSDLISLFRTTSFWLASHSTFIRRDLVEKYGGQNPKLYHHCDFFLNHIIALSEGVLYVPRTTIAYFRESAHNIGTRCSKAELKTVSWNLVESVAALDAPLRERVLRCGILSHTIKNIFPEIALHPHCWKLLFFVLLRWFNLNALGRKSSLCFSMK
ncbi:MAG: glycosyltransferase family 2 protein [Chlamydiales bacterium]|nr:glycosyltransferase family 2 protein [Chlamydiales bacterium]